MPVKLPKIFQWHQFRVAVGKSHVDGAGHFLAGVKILRRAGGIDAAMPRNGCAAHAGQTPGALIKIAIRRITFQRPRIHPVGIKNTGVCDDF